MKELLTFIIIIAAFVGGVGWYVGWFGGGGAPTEEERMAEEQEQDTQVEENVREPEEIIGTSVNGHDITAYHYWGANEAMSTTTTEQEQVESEFLFVGGIHGGYEWNTVLLAYELMDYLEQNPSAVPAGMKVTVIPTLNPDGLETTVGTTTGNFTANDVASDAVPGRFNGNEVDLNRNFDCNWADEATWRDNPVDPGSAAFSEPESKAIRDYVQANPITAAVVWYSAAGGVYESKCNGEDVMAETTDLMNIYADASGYPAEGYFDAYAITGDMVDWLAKNQIPAVSVLLTNHTNTEWEENRAGVEAVLEEYKN